MKLKVIGLSSLAISAASSAVLLCAAPPAAGRLRVDISSPTDRSRQQWNSHGPFAVTVSYDGKSTKFGELPANDVVLRATYVFDADAPSARRAVALPDALVQVSQSNCAGCHDFEANAAGPSFAAISTRYGGKANAAAMLAGHIRSGSKGSWGSGIMPPHPDLTPAQSSAIALWILSLRSNPSVHYSVGKSGSFEMTPAGKPGPRSGVVLSAFYTGPLEGGGSRAGEGRNLVVVYGS